MSEKFFMYRFIGHDGVSGTGHVLDGIKFDNGKVAVSWLGKGDIKVSSVAIYDSMDDFVAVHVKREPENETRIIWENEPEFIP